MPKLYLSSCHIQCFLKANVLAQKENVRMQTETASSKVSVHAFQQHILKLNSFALRKFLRLWILEFNDDSVTSKVEWDHESYWKGQLGNTAGKREARFKVRKR